MPTAVTAPAQPSESHAEVSSTDELLAGENAAATAPAVRDQPLDGNSPADLRTSQSNASLKATLPSESKSTSDATSPRTAAAPTKTAAPLNSAPPSAEQIARWRGSEEYATLQLLACYDGFSDPLVHSMAIAPDGRQFVLSGSRLTVWSLGQVKPEFDLLDNLTKDKVERPIRVVSISPDGKWLASGDQEGGLRIYNLSDRSQSASWAAHQGRLMALAYSPDSQQLATTSYSGEVSIWHLPDGKLKKSFKASEREIARLLFLSNERLVIAGAETSVWNVPSGSRESLLSTDYVIGPAIDKSQDGRWLAFADSDSKVHLWDIERQALAAGAPLSGQGLSFSNDGKWLAGYSLGSIVIWDVARRQIVQVIDTTGSRTAELKWLPQGHLLLVASVEGRVRLWGTAESAQSIGVQPLALPLVAAADPQARKPYSSAQLQQVIDVRSFPRLPGAVGQWTLDNVVAYQAPATQGEAEQFYRYYLGRDGWSEIPMTETGYPGLTFTKSGCQLNITFTPADTTLATPPGTEKRTELQVSMSYAGNFDARWLPKHAQLESKNSYGFFSTASYRTKAELTDVEVSLLKQFHADGWTAYTRLDASSREEPLTRRISLVQGGSELTVSIGHPADSGDELAVQTSLSVENKSLPIPADSGWIEYDSSTDLKMVANTKMDFGQTIKFYDARMPAEGWLPRDANRFVKDGKAWLPYIRGGQDVLIRLVSLPNGKTRIIVGEAERSSWQLQKPPQETSDTVKPGIEVADFTLPAGAKETRYDVDAKNIEFTLDSVTPTVLAEQFIKQMTALDWKQEKAGVKSEEYMFVTFSKEKVEIQLRARLVDMRNSSAMISGDGLLWTKPLPTAHERISYEAWLRRQRFEASLELLDQFASEMKRIPAH